MQASPLRMFFGKELMGMTMISKYLTNTIETGLVIGKGEKYIASKGSREEFFASVWIGCEEKTDKAWGALVEEIARNFNYEIVNKYYPVVEKYRLELEVLEKND